jgi:ECF sigma factor
VDPLAGEVTRLLCGLRSGKKHAEAQLFSLVYDELRRIAGAYFRRERADHTLQPTALEDFDVAAPSVQRPEELIDLDDALCKLEEFDPRQNP